MFNLFASFLIWAIRGWCTWRGRVRVIERWVDVAPGPTQKWAVRSEPYLIRYALFGWLPGDKTQRRWLNLPNIYLHNILLPDADPALHNHPWPWALSLILRGGYREEYQTPKCYPATNDRFLTAGQLNLIRANTFHRIACAFSTLRFYAVGCDMQIGGCWTLFITSGGKRQPWGFAVPGQGFVPHRERNLFASRRTLIPPALADEKVRVSL